MQDSGNNENQVGELGEEYIEDSPEGYNMQEMEEDLGLQKKIIAEAHENGYGAKYREDIKKVVIESDKNFKMSVPVKKNHAVRFSNVCGRPYQPRGNLPVPAEVDFEQSNNESQKYEIINSEEKGSKDDIYNQNEKESNNNKSKKSQNSINFDEYEIEDY